MFDETYIKIAVLGLGYVGLPLAVEFSKFHEVVGFDLNQNRINELKNSVDSSGECSKTYLIESDDLNYTSDSEELTTVNFYIICVPTPVDKNKNPEQPIVDLGSNKCTIIM